MASSLFQVVMFLHEVCLITIDQLSYHDPPSHSSPNKTTPSMAYMESMHFMSTTTIDDDPAPTECDLIALVPPPHHFGLEVGKVHLPLGEPTSRFSPVYESNFVFSPIVSDNTTCFLSPQYSIHHSHLTSYFDGP